MKYLILYCFVSQSIYNYKIEYDELNTMHLILQTPILSFEILLYIPPFNDKFINKMKLNSIEQQINKLRYDINITEMKIKEIKKKCEI